jgi:hypothetical protein
MLVYSRHWRLASLPYLTFRTGFPSANDSNILSVANSQKPAARSEFVQTRVMIAFRGRFR